MLAILGTAIGNSRALEVKKSWNEGPRIYCAVVARSGTAKSPALDLAMKPMAKRQEALMSETERKKYEAKALAGLNAADATKPETENIAEDHSRSQLFTTDATVEALAALLEENPRGIAFMRDELTGWVRSMNQYRDGAGSDRQSWLSFWSGSAIVVNRKGTAKEKPKPIRVPRPFVNVAGGIPPDMLGELSDEKGREDGFIQRVLFSFPAEVGLRWNRDKVVTEDALQQYQDIFDTLLNLAPDKNEFGNVTPHLVRFASEAKERFDEWIENHHAELNKSRIPEGLRGTWAKLIAYCARFCLILHLSRCAAGEIQAETVDAESVQRAIKLVEYFKSHAWRVYDSLNSTKEDKKVEEAVAWIRTHGGSATIREFVTNRVAGCRKADEAELLFKEMRDRGRGKIEFERPEHGGHETQRFRLSSSNLHSAESKA